MFLIQKSSSIQYLIDLYHTHIATRLTKKSKNIGVGTAVIITLLYYIHNRILKPPKELRHIPYQTYYSFFGSVLRKESLRDLYRRDILPAFDHEKNDGIYLRPFNGAWNVTIANPAHAKKILFNTDVFPKITPDNAISKTLFGRFAVGPNIAMLNGPAWKAQRKIANPAFHRSMPVNLFGDLTLEFFQVVDESNGVVEFTDLITRWSLDAIGKSGFGFDFNAISQKDSDWVNTYSIISNGIIEPINFVFPFLDQHDSIWLSSKRRQLHRHLDRFLEMIDQVILKKREAVKKGDLGNGYLPEHEKDLLTLMIEGEMRGEGVMSDEELKSNVCLFFLAGHETTSNALSFAIYHLATNPEIQQRARDEAIKIMGDEPENVVPTLEQLKQFVYINQIIKEVLRIDAPVTRVIPRTSSEDFVLNGTLIPKGSFVSVDLTAIHHSRKVWSNPEKFDPERFAEGGEASLHDAGSGMSWLPFSIGGRQCAGMKMSLYQQRVFLSMLLRKYTWKLPENSIHKQGVIQKGTFTVGPVDMEIEFTKRY
ncbi:cytochrome P450 [Blakeslea trispora]|nr:cytochrome P450 [Blakeslea trispora]